MSVSLNGPAVGNQSPVSGGIVVANFAALLALPDPVDGQQATVSAPIIGSIASGGVPFTRWVYIAGYGWRLHGRQYLVIDLVTAAGVASTLPQALKSYLMPPGLLPRLRAWNGYMSTAKSGVTDAAAYAGWRVGLTGTASDGSLAYTTGFVAMSRQFFIGTLLDFPTVTQARYFGTGVNEAASGIGTSQLGPVLVSTPDQGVSGIYMTAYMQMSGTTDTPSVNRVLIEGV